MSPHLVAGGVAILGGALIVAGQLTRGLGWRLHARAFATNSELHKMARVSDWLAACRRSEALLRASAVVSLVGAIVFAVGVGALGGLVLALGFAP